jgi:hypothetical protein
MMRGNGSDATNNILTGGLSLLNHMSWGTKIKTHISLSGLFFAKLNWLGQK